MICLKDSKENARIAEFGNRKALDENILYHLFCDQNKQDYFYLKIFYGIDLIEQVDLGQSQKYRRLFTKKIEYQQKRLNRIASFIDSFKRPGLWLDMGCGIGQFINRLLQNEDNYVIGSDVSYSCLSKAKSLLQQINSKAQYSFINQDELKLPFKDNAFDYILSADVLEHVGYENQSLVIKEIFRVLKNGGYALIHTPNFNRVRITTLIKKITHTFKGYNPLIITHSFPKDHISLASAKNLSKLCSSAGFASKVYYQKISSPNSLIKRALSIFDFLIARSFILILYKQ